MEGWITLHRKIKKHFIWKDPEKLWRWIDLLLLASYDNQKVLVGSTVVTCKRGEILTSLNTLAKSWGCSKHAVLNFLILLESDSMIVRKRVQRMTHITICNYGLYQDMSDTSGNDAGTIGERCGNDAGTITYIKQINNINNNNLKDNPESGSDEFDFNSLIGLFHRTCRSLPRVEKITTKRKRQILARDAEIKRAGGNWAEIFAKVENSDFLCGRKTEFKASLDFIIRSENSWVKIIEGQYDNIKHQGDGSKTETYQRLSRSSFDD